MSRATLGMIVAVISSSAAVSQVPAQIRANFGSRPSSTRSRQREGDPVACSAGIQKYQILNFGLSYA